MYKDINPEETRSFDIYESTPILNPEKKENGLAKATASSSIFNLVNSIIGSGVLSIPFAIRVSGLIPGVFFILLIWYVSNFSFEKLAVLSNKTQTFSYKSIAAIFYGKNMAVISEVSIILYTFAGIIARFIILGDFLTDVFMNWISNSSNIMVKLWFVKILVFLIMFPFCLLRNIDNLKFTSIISLFCIAFAVFVVVYRMAGLTNLPSHLHQIKLFDLNPQMFVSFGVLVVSFCAHYNLPRLYEELDNRTTSRMNGVIRISTGICLVSYILIGVCGYITFGSDTAGNILDNYGDHDLLALIARLCLSVALVFSTPLVLFACRRSIITLTIPTKPFSWFNWTFITFLILAFSCGVAILVTGIQVVFGFTGGTIGVFFIFILPGLFFLRINKYVPEFQVNQEEISNNIINSPSTVQPVPYHRIAGWFLIFSGLALGVLGTTGSVLNVLNKK